MNFKDWAPYYDKILAVFGFSKENDEKSAACLSDYVRQHFPPATDVPLFEIRGREVIVCGNAPSLKEEWKAWSLREQKKPSDLVVIAADGAASVLMKLNICPNVIVTDLDGRHEDDVDFEIDAYSKGAIILIHAHGDNLDKLTRYLPILKQKSSKDSVLIPTCQCRPPNNIYNFGGFTDGDRCVFLAEAFKAETITLLGFDFEDPDVSAFKKKKLNCARHLIQVLNDKRIRDGKNEIRYFRKSN
ncbi:hypothetical protein MsAg5_10700 [Methanosarcinaceae archaeon Ag5]|uniref:6-hydroxymethyl-7,8-dihydropterin pyrophosphokinase n=1 Tax=Methanolapillus africanus TaxID=3028297 RepID=A0AAE4SD56_9EURY|nr:hypothetical protein [Methanosarcinaceae archaeon Ag5]